MLAIIGLGNPGPHYDQTRHNVGAMTTEFIARQIALGEFSHNKRLHARVAKSKAAIFAIPDTYMNESGQAARAVVRYHLRDEKERTKYEKLFVIHDDLDISLGNYKIQLGVGPREHNGLKSIYAHLGTQRFWHIRIGIDTPDRRVRTQPRDFVLERFLTEEAVIIRKVQERIAIDMKNRIEQG